MRLRVAINLLSLIVFYSCGLSAHEWTKSYRWILQAAERAANAQKTHLIYRQESQAFNQLIFSWNALRPEKGHFSFFVQVRDASSKKWGNWHHMTDWGKDVQHSYESAADFISKFCYVRLEVNQLQKADAFAIDIKAEKGASLQSLFAISTCLSDLSLFKSERAYWAQMPLPSVRIKDVPTISQYTLPHERNGGLCSPTACSILATYLLRHPINPLYFATHCYDNGLKIYGSWPFNVAHAFEVCKASVYFTVMRLHSFSSLIQSLAKGVPVVVSVRGHIPNAPRQYPQGHLMVIIGYDNKTGMVLVHDSAGASNDQTIRSYKLDDFLKAWEKSHRLAYIADPTISFNQSLAKEKGSL